jgi:hypothetical protein
VAQSLETLPTPVVGASPSASDVERDENAWNIPRQAPGVTLPADSVSHGTRDEELDWKRFVATYFPDTSRHNFKAIIAYSDYRRSFHMSKRSGEPDAETPSTEE